MAKRRWLGIAARIAEVMTIAVALAVLILWCSIPNPAPLVRANPASTAFIDLRRDQAAATGKPFTLQWRWQPLGRISRYLRAAIIYAEDHNFYRHDGVDWKALRKAVDTNLDAGNFSVGGSTITQQLAKNLYLSPDRSLTRKLRELLITRALERELSKQRILELYLNVVEWGDGVFGAEAASIHWFARPAQTLSPAQAARLAVALPNPITRAPNVRDPVLVGKAVRIVHLLRRQGLIDEPQERLALDELGAPDEPTLRSRPPPPSP